MKNKLLVVLLSVTLAGTAMAQTTTRLGQHDAIRNWQTPANSFASKAEANGVAQQIMDAVGLKPNFELMPANIPNAAAVVYGGKRYILYNPNFINQLTKTTGTRWAAISVLAHEIGHHLDGHTVTATGSQPQLELEADEFSGFVLRKMGATLQQAQAAMRTIADGRASATHPAQYDRLASIEKGWRHADGQASTRDVAEAEPAPAPQQEPEVVRQPQRREIAVADRNIIGEVRFNADPSSAYYVTSRYNVVKMTNNQLYVIGKVANLNSTQYPYLIYDENNTQLLVDRTGNIVTKRGQQVGYLRARRT